MSTDNSTIGNIFSAGLDVAGGINPILGNVISGMKNAAAQKKKETLISDYAANTNAKYNKLVNQDYLDTNVGRSMMTRIKEQLKNANNMADKQGATTGATNEATLAAKTANQGQYNDVVSQIAGMGTAREDQMIGRQQNAQDNILGLETGIEDDHIQAAQTQAANANETMQSILGAVSTTAGAPSAGAVVDGGSNQLMGGVSADQALTDTSVQIAAPATAESQFGYNASENFAKANPSQKPWDKYWALQFVNQ
jgi:hypothetical protein